MFKILFEPNAATTWDKYYDMIEIYDEDGELCHTTFVESTEETEPYDDAVKALIGDEPYEWSY